MDPIVFEGVELSVPEQKHFDGVGAFPFVYGVAQSQSSSVDEADSLQSQSSSIEEAVKWVQANKKTLENKLLHHGAILFRGFPTNDATAFNTFVEAFGFENLPYIGGAAPRKQVVGNVFTANEAPPEADIPFHHEMSSVPNYPKKLFFYGDVAPEIGGETPILLSNEVYKRMVAKHPEFVEKLERLGAKYTRTLPEENDETTPQGRGWKATYGVNTKEEVEQKVTSMNMDFKWLDNGELQTVSAKPIPAVQVDERTGQKVWFNGIMGVYLGWNDVRHVGEKCVHFGDGSPMERSVIEDIRDIMDEVCVNHKWEQGDVIMIDNRVAMHGRRPFVGTRKIYAYLTRT